MEIMKLKLDYENPGFSRTHYVGYYKDKKYNIVIIHNSKYDEICTASKDGEPDSPIKASIKFVLDDKVYITKKVNPDWTDATTFVEDI